MNNYDLNCDLIDSCREGSVACETISLALNPVATNFDPPLMGARCWEMSKEKIEAPNACILKKMDLDAMADHYSPSSTTLSPQSDMFFPLLSDLSISETSSRTNPGNQDNSLSMTTKFISTPLRLTGGGDTVSYTHLTLPTKA